MSSSLAEPVPQRQDRFLSKQPGGEGSVRELAVVLLHPSMKRKRETPLRPVPDLPRNGRVDRTEKQRLVGAAPELRPVRKTANGRNQRVVEKRHAGLDGVSHRHHVGIAEKLVSEIVRELQLDGGIQRILMIRDQRGNRSTGKELLDLARSEESAKGEIELRWRRVREVLVLRTRTDLEFRWLRVGYVLVLGWLRYVSVLERTGD
jgi:hypothetical protein